MATEAEINAQLLAVNAQIAKALTGAPFDHEEGEFKVVKSRSLDVLFKERERLENALTMIPAITTHQEDFTIGPFGGVSAVFRGDVNA